MYTRGMGEPIVAMTTPPVQSGTPAWDIYGASWCGSGNPLIDFFCPDSATKPLQEQIIMDPSVYGSQMTEENKRLSEAMARAAIAADDPCNYSEINGMSWIDKIGCNLKTPGGSAPNFVPVALFVGAVALFSVLRH